MELAEVKVNVVDNHVLQDSPVVLPDTQEPTQIRSIGFITETLPIKHIQNLRGFMYSKYRTDLDRPHVARTPEGEFLLDGLDLVIDAEKDGNRTITSDVESFDVHCEPELCFRAAGSRMKPRGGHAPYMEKCVTVRFLLNMLLSTDENLQIFGHGGKRSSDGSAGNREDDARQILCKKFNNNRDTINSYLSHIAYLHEEAIEYFIEQDVNKAFFDDVRKEKTNLLNRLIGEKVGDDQLPNQISDFMIQAYEEYVKVRKEGKKKGKKTNPQQAEPSPNADQSQNTTDTVGSTEEADNTNPEPDENPESDLEDNANDDGESSEDEGPPSVPQIKLEVIGVSQRLSARVEQTDSLDDLEQSIKEELNNLMIALNRISFLKSKAKVA